MSCANCESVFGPREVDGIRELQTFKGYTVDFKLREFRKVRRDGELKFIDFDSPKGRQLQKHMHNAAQATFVWLID